MTTNAPAPAGWYPDQMRRYELRYWDGARWTPHVVTQGQQYVDGPPAPVLTQERPRPEPAALVAGSGSIFTEPTLILLERKNALGGDSFAVLNRAGTQVATAQQTGGKGSRMLGAALSLGSNLSRTLEVVDAGGRVVLVVSRPAKVMKSRILVHNGQGIEIGVIRQENVVGSVDFAIECGTAKIGSITGKGALLRDQFTITDAQGTEVARIAKELPPDLATAIPALVGEFLTGADSYVVEIAGPLPDPLRSLVVAAALAIDTALHSD